MLTELLLLRDVSGREPFTAGPPGERPPRGASFTARVVAITDGDTIRVLQEDRNMPVRLNGIDSPEKGQPFGTRAKQFSADLAFGMTVTISVRDLTRYGRAVADVGLADGRVLNHELVRAGLAWWYRKYAPHDEMLERLEREARDTRRGLWVDADPAPPWKWRKR